METNNNFESIQVGKTYKFDDLIHDSLMTRFGEMNLLKLVNNDKITEVIKAPRQLLKVLAKTPGATQFTIKKVVLDGEYKNYIIDCQ